MTTTPKAEAQRKPRSPQRTPLIVELVRKVLFSEDFLRVVAFGSVIGGFNDGFVGGVSVVVSFIVSVIRVLRSVVRNVVRNAGQVGTPDGQRTQQKVPTAAMSGSVPNRVAGWSVRLLPVQERERYRNEYSAELSELRGQAWRSQVGYALRLLAYSVRLRQELQQSGPAPTRQRDR